MPMSATEARSKWNQLENAIKVIFRRNSSSLSFMELHQITFELVKGSQGEIIATGLRRTFEEYLDRETRLSVLNARADEQFLQLLSLFWNDHLLSVKMIRDILMVYDNKYANNTQKVHVMGVRLFDDIILSEDICEHVTARAVSLISGEREGKMIETGIIRDISRMLISIGDLTYYVENIENPFLLDTATYYGQKAKQFLDQKNVMSYLQAVNKFLQEEQLRVKKHFDPTTEAKLIKLFDKILIDEQLEILSNIKDGDIKYLLENRLVSKEPYVYAILKRVKSGIKFIEEAIRKYMVETVKQYNSEPNIADNPELYIETILQLRVYISSVTQEIAITNIQKEIDNDFASAFNKHTKCAEFLAHYLNCKLKKGNSGDENFIENHLEDIIVLFRYLEEKDIFEHFYKRYLSTRLLNEASVSKEAEAFVITKLKEEAGYMFTQNMEKLFKDRELWDDAATDFTVYKLSKQNINDPSNISVRVITSGFWPIPEINNVIFPQLCQNSIETFKQYYNEKFTGRKINIHPLLGTAELKCTFFGKEKKNTTKILISNTATMILLLRFNSKPMLKYKDFKADTLIPEKEIKRILTALALGKSSQKILIRKGKENEIEDEDEFTVNDAFTSSQIKIKIQLPVSKKDKEPKKVVASQVMAERNNLIDSAVVRIMKARKKIQHNTLMEEVIVALKARFNPQPVNIKKRIESLIDRHYMNRLEDNQNIYQYIQ